MGEPLSADLRKQNFDTREVISIHISVNNIWN